MVFVEGQEISDVEEHFMDGTDKKILGRMRANARVSGSFSGGETPLTRTRRKRKRHQVDE